MLKRFVATTLAAAVATAALAAEPNGDGKAPTGSALQNVRGTDQKARKPAAKTAAKEKEAPKKTDAKRAPIKYEGC